MKQRHIQSFLMVSAAFFAINVPIRPSTSAPSESVGASQRVAHARRMDARAENSVQESEQNEKPGTDGG
jgi:hypothetical protein